MLEAMTRNWSAYAFRGAVAIVLGILAILWPGATVGVFVILLAAFALIEGVINVAAGIRGREGWAIFEGVVSVIAGVVMLAWPAITALVLLYLVAAWAIITGVARIVAAIQLRRVLRNEWMLVGSGCRSAFRGAPSSLCPFGRV